MYHIFTGDVVQTSKYHLSLLSGLVHNTKSGVQINITKKN